MGYKEMFAEEEVFDFENQLLELMGSERDDYADPLWNDINFVLNALPYFDYKSGFGILDEFVSENFYDNVFVVCAIIKNLRAVHNYIGIEYVLGNVPEHAWSNQASMFLHNVMCADITALQFAPEDTLTEKIIIGALSQYDFVEKNYILGYTKIVECIPTSLWKNNDFMETIKEKIRSVFTYVNRLDDLNEILKLIDSKNI